jgi:hypothetical protein
MTRVLRPLKNKILTRSFGKMAKVNSPVTAEIRSKPNKDGKSFIRVEFNEKF